MAVCVPGAAGDGLYFVPLPGWDWLPMLVEEPEVGHTDGDGSEPQFGHLTLWLVLSAIS